MQGVRCRNRNEIKQVPINIIRSKRIIEENRSCQPDAGTTVRCLGLSRQVMQKYKKKNRCEFHIKVFKERQATIQFGCLVLLILIPAVHMVFITAIKLHT